MHLTLHSDFALRTLLYLATRPEEVTSVGVIAQAYGISAHHLSKVGQKLTHAGFVDVVRGPSGGLRLARPAKAISLGAVVRALEPSLALVECFDPETNTCPIVPVCGLKGILADARDQFMKHLDAHSLADAVGKPQALAALLGRERLVRR